jgi:uncharacterized protein YbjQ (UPF0145 family)
MKKRKMYMAGIFMIIVITVFLTTGCTMTQPVSSDIIFSNEGVIRTAEIAVKDFISLGLVFTEVQSTEVVETRSYPPRMTFNGNVFTYYELLKEAQKLGADAIINVTIDYVMMTRSESGGFRITKNHTWYGSALAIKYTDAMNYEYSE